MARKIAMSSDDVQQQRLSQADAISTSTHQKFVGGGDIPAVYVMYVGVCHVFW